MAGDLTAEQLMADLEELLNEFSIAHLRRTPSVALSGGERRRLEITRALVTEPACVLADEPTGNLDSQTSESVHSLFFDLNRRHGTTFLIVTHSRDFAAMMPRQVSMKDGRIVADERRAQPLENQGKPT